MSEFSLEPDGVVRGAYEPTERVRVYAVLALMILLFPLGFVCCVWVYVSWGEVAALCAFAALAAIEFGLALAMRGITRRGWREVERANFRLCLSCRHPLVARPAVRDWHCLECAASWDEHVLERSWRWTYMG